MVLCLSGSRGFENCFQVPFKPHELRCLQIATCLTLASQEALEVMGMSDLLTHCWPTLLMLSGSQIFRNENKSYKNVTLMSGE